MAKFNYYLGIAASSLLLWVMVIFGELYEPFKNMLKDIFTHHWIGKGVVITAAFLILGFLLRNRKSAGEYSDENIAWYSTLGSLIIILLFYIIHYFIS